MEGWLAGETGQTVAGEAERVLLFTRGACIIDHCMSGYLADAGINYPQGVVVETVETLRLIAVITHHSIVGGTVNTSRAIIIHHVANRTAKTGEIITEKTALSVQLTAVHAFPIHYDIGQRT